MRHIMCEIIIICTMISHLPVNVGDNKEHSKVKSTVQLCCALMKQELLVR